MIFSRLFDIKVISKLNPSFPPTKTSYKFYQKFPVVTLKNSL